MRGLRERPDLLLHTAHRLAARKAATAPPPTLLNIGALGCAGAVKPDRNLIET